MAGVGLIANLKPFQPGNKAPRRSAKVNRAIREVRKLGPKAAEFCKKVLEDDAEDTSNRVRVALAIINKIMPDAGTDALAGDGSRVAAISVYIMRDEQPPTIDAEAAQPPKLTVRSFTLGSGND